MKKIEKLSIDDFAEPFRTSTRHASPITQLKLIRRWKEASNCYLTVIDLDQLGPAVDLMIQSIVVAGERRYAVLTPPPSISLDLDRKPLYLMKVRHDCGYMLSASECQRIISSSLGNVQFDDMEDAECMFGFFPEWCRPT